MEIISNHKPRNLLYGYELTAKERAQFDYISTDEMDSHEFMRYRGQVFDVSEFMAAPDDLKPWQGIANDTYFSGTLLRFVDCDRVIVGRYCV